VKKENVAIHEAGHAVAHCRLDLDVGFCTINPTEEKLGSLSGEGAGHVSDSDGAKNMVLAYCAGYAAMIADGKPEDEACRGCGDDFENAEQIISFWTLPGNLDVWKKRAVELMSKPENVRAVEVIAAKLLEFETIDGDHLMVLVEVADGVSTKEDYERYLVVREAAGFRP
jgi:ATP-dependent Zn protease